MQRIFRKYYSVSSPELKQKIFGLDFPNPVGLAAGFDKDAELIDQLAVFGFGFIEVGTITPRPQSGNKRPRLFRLPADKALINRMGFNNRGVRNALKRLRKRSSGIIIGGNIGKNKQTPNESAHSDYEQCLEDLYDVVDYFVVNVSSPNTPDLRELQEKPLLTNLLTRLKERAKLKRRPKPILLKIAPDLNEEQLDDIIQIVKDTGIDGLIVSNTTIMRDGLTTTPAKLEKIGAGGLSGLPLKSRSSQMIKYVRKHMGEKIPIIGVGGIFTCEDALEKLEAGANLVQVYTGFIYEGPSQVKKINKGLLKSSWRR